MGPGPWLEMAHSTHVTLLHYVSNFWPQKLDPSPWPNPGSAPVLLSSSHTGNIKWWLWLKCRNQDSKMTVDVWLFHLSWKISKVNKR